MHLEKYAPIPQSQSSPATPPKRRKLTAGDGNSNRTLANTTGRTVSTQQLISKSFRVTKPARDNVHNSQQHVPGPPPASTLSPTGLQTWSLQDTPYEDTDQYPSSCQRYQIPTNCYQHTSMQDHNKENVAGSEFGDGVGRSGPSSHRLPTRNEGCPERQEALATFLDEDDFEDGVIDDDLLSLMPDPSSMFHDDPSTGEFTEGGATVKSEAKDDITNETSMVMGELVSSEGSRRCSKSFKSPLTQTYRLLAATGDIGNPHAHKPIVRPLFPAAVRDRSPIIGLSSNTLLKTCFRVGEAMNQSNQALKSGQNVIFELYARILESDRTETQQTFTFCDIFHARPPYIKANYHAAIWKSVPLFEYDGRRLLQKGRMCRTIGTMKRIDKQWVLTVLNIWEATWEDIKWVEGIVCF